MLPVAQIIEGVSVSAAARSLARTNASPDRFVAALENQELFLDALTFLAHALSRREAVWWGSLCAWHVLGPKLAANADACLKSVVAWVREPSEANRRAAETASEAAGPGTIAGFLGLAVFASSGSVVPANVPAIPPPESMTAECVASAVWLAGCGKPQVCREFLAVALDIARGKNRWE